MLIIDVIECSQTPRRNENKSYLPIDAGEDRQFCRLTVYASRGCRASAAIVILAN
jgi:hypothetical protein